MKQDIPEKMRAIILHNYNTNIVNAIKSLDLVELPVPKPNKGQVLIKVEATTCNPSDLSFIQGSYGIKKELPIVPGFEGTGIVVDADKDAHAQLLLGKRVSFNSHPQLNGSWAEYCVTNTNACIPVHSAITIEQAACMLVNPYTAFALFDIIKERKSKAFIMNASSGQLAGMLQNLAKKENIKIINIVRKNNQIELLKSKGEEYVLSSSEADFLIILKELIQKLGATTFIDAVSGEVSGKILELMPPSSQLILYGALTGENLNYISAKDLIFSGKSIVGFNLIKWFENKTMSEISEVTSKLQEKMVKGEIKTEIYKKVHFEEVNTSLVRYIINMSAGKIIIEP
ncbi:MAG: zinc-binding dehydrogenase [Bacteroidales bacterium]|nr:zinc-binding dehydrogenase [Bacteroidales bacterium]MBN2757990.1 zinc-binding dehydrogenase [Bacteroidales bacterium]